MSMLAGLDVRDHFAHINAVFPDRIAYLHVLEGDLVANGNILQGGHGGDFVFVHDPALMPSTTTTATVSLASCNTKWFIVAPFDKVRKMHFSLQV
jgi:hypothetical protein